MVLKIKQFVIIITIICFASCKQENPTLVKIDTKQISITDSIPPAQAIIHYISPYQKRIDEVLDSTLAYALHTISKTDGRWNSTAGNLMADAVLQLAGPIFKSRTQHDLDFVLLNHGGIRSIISKGNVTTRTAYEIMPFENSIVVVALKGKAIREMVSYLINSKVPHPIAGLQIIIARNGSLKAVTINGKPFDENKTYYIATSDYLVTGGDRMNFFKEKISITETDYLIRNIMIDYFKKYDTIAPTVDNRFIKLED